MAIVERQPRSIEGTQAPQIQIIEHNVTIREIEINRIKADILILSDLHMGSSYGNSNAAGRILTSVDTPWIILNGDTYDENNVEGKLQWADERFIGILKTLLNPIAVTNQKVRGTLIAGNHDDHMGKNEQVALGLIVQPFEIIEIGGVKVAVIHGHQGAGCLNTQGSIVGKLAIATLYIAMLVGQKKTFDKVGNKVYKLSDKVAKGAFEFAQIKGASVVVCGHTHSPEHRVENGIHYINPGGFGAAGNGFLTLDVNSDGVVANRYILSS